MGMAAAGSLKQDIIERSRSICADTSKLTTLAQTIGLGVKERWRRKNISIAISAARFYTVMLKLSSVAYVCSSVKQPLIMSVIHMCSALTTVSYVGICFFNSFA